MVTKEILLQHFQTIENIVDDDAILDKCLELCGSWDVEEEKFVEIWVAFCVSHGFDDFHVTIERLKQLENAHERTTKEENDNQSKGFSEKMSYQSQPTNSDFQNNDILEMYGCNQPVTPRIKRSRSPEAQKSIKFRAIENTFSPSSYGLKVNTPSRYSTKDDSGRILVSFGEKVLTWRNENIVPLKISKHFNAHVSDDIHYMFDLPSDQNHALTTVCRYIGTELCKSWAIEDKNDEIVYTRNIKNTDQIIFRSWGRVSDVSNIKTVILEGSERLKGSKCAPAIEVNLENIKQFSFFPGQIVAVECENTTQNTLTVKQVFTKNLKIGNPLNPSLTQNINVVIAAGPFTMSDGMHYQPLWDLLPKIADEEPNVLILIGPFIDCDHPDIHNNPMKHTFQEFFEMIMDKILEYFNGKSVEIILVASNKDVFHEPVFPTPRYVSKSLKNSKIHFMPDPCVIDIEGITIGTSSVDILKHLASKEISDIRGMDRMSRLANHILTNGCFYPMYPPAPGLNIDIGLWKKFCFFNRIPHLLILPSDTRYFCKDVRDCVIINPERLYKGTYAKVCIRPVTEGKWSSQNVSCEILRV